MLRDPSVPSGATAWIETGTPLQVPRLLSRAKTLGVDPLSTRWIIVTHAHLDHASGAARLAAACPQAQVYAHPRAARHLIDPAKLEAAARAVYTDAVFEKLYGAHLEPIDARRVVALDEGAEVETPMGMLKVWHTHGHARHHLCVIDEKRDAIFTGDTFGLAYRALQTRGLFVFPTTSPTDFDALEARASIHRIAESGLGRAYLTHFGEVKDLKLASEQLLSWIDRSEAVMDRCRDRQGTALVEACETELRQEFAQEIARRGLSAGRETWEWIELDLKLNAQGLAWAIEKSRKTA